LTNSIKKWSQGKILKKLPEPRSYLVKIQGGNTLRRNVQWLKNRVKKEYEENTETGDENILTD